MSSTEYEFSPVPQEKKKGAVTLSLIWFGYVIVIGSTLIGGGLAGGLSLRDEIWLVYLGCGILAVIASLCSVVAHQTGLSFSLAIKGIFGIHGSKLVEILVPIIFAGWYAINTSLLGEVLAKRFGLSSLGEGIVMVLAGLAMVSTAYLGIKGLGYFSYMSNLVIVVLAGFAIYHGLQLYHGSLDSLLQGESQMPYTTALEVIIGAWIFGAIIVSMDLMRFSKSARSSIVSASIGLLIGTAPSILIGAFTAKAINNPNPVEMLFDIGSSFWFVAALLLLVLNVWDTNDENLYSAGLSLVNFTTDFSNRFKREHAVVVIGIVASLLTLIRPHRFQVLFTFLGLLGKIIPPLAGIILAHYLLSRQVGAPFDFLSKRKWNTAPLIAWLIGAIAAFLPELFSKVDVRISVVQLGSLNGLLVSFLSYFVIAKGKLTRPYASEEIRIT